ncbi:hypothetical protein evm_007178 [Chilo suppressalis]|nr:hypothetical protein evm_007178 [Chilo suppressalis]
MGGKAKSSQRTKNNVRPSSSGRSAELLNNAVNLDPSLLTGGKMMSALFPTLATPVLDQGIPAEFSICIKKLNKKDPVTKVKALQELSDLVGSSKVDDVVLVLPSWAHFYKILSVDTDCKVREMAQMCQGSFAAACGRRLAAVLRRLVPAWLQAQYDEHAPAAAHAQHALKVTLSLAHRPSPSPSPSHTDRLVPAWLQAQYDEHAPAAAHAQHALKVTLSLAHRPSPSPSPSHTDRLVPAWLQAQYDEHAPAAAHAQHALKVTLSLAHRPSPSPSPSHTDRLVPAWLQAQYDEHAPAAAHAQHALKVTLSLAHRPSPSPSPSHTDRLVPAWLQAQYDEHAPAAAHAQHALKVTLSLAHRPSPSPSPSHTDRLVPAWLQAQYDEHAPAAAHAQHALKVTLSLAHRPSPSPSPSHTDRLVPAWLQAQYDEHAPAAAHAQHALKVTLSLAHRQAGAGLAAGAVRRARAGCCARATCAEDRLVPAWLQAQYDEHAPAAAHAQHALKVTLSLAHRPSPSPSPSHTDRLVPAWLQAQYDEHAPAAAHAQHRAEDRLVPAWLQAQYDEHAPAAAHAQHALKVTLSLAHRPSPSPSPSHTDRLVPAWLQAQYDEHAPAAAHAQHALKVTLSLAHRPSPSPSPSHTDRLVPAWLQAQYDEHAPAAAHAQHALKVTLSLAHRPSPSPSPSHTDRLVPAWLQAQYDEHAPAAAHAQHALKVTLSLAHRPSPSPSPSHTDRLVPAWLQAQYDEHAPAAAHAQHALKVTLSLAHRPSPSPSPSHTDRLVPAWLQAQYDEHAPAAAHAQHALKVTLSLAHRPSPSPSPSHTDRLVPAWLQAQYDEHAPAAAHAQHALKATFPENKLPEVISFCKNEVMAHLIDTLIGNAQKTLIKPAEEAEERELQLQRLVISSLQGLQYFVAHLPEEHHDWLWQQLQPLLAANAFWKYANNASVPLRAVWFASVSRVAGRFASTFAAQAGARALKLVLAAAHDAPPALAPFVWGCLLQFMHSVPDWHKYLDRKDLLMKRMLDMLEKGGWGDAKRLTDMLLPLLAHLPPEMLTKEFYEIFFNSFFKGLEKKSILISKSERQHWIASIAECLRYLSIQQSDFAVEVTTAVHRNWLKFALSSEREGQLKTNLIKHSATNMAALVKFWLKQSTETNGEKYDQLIRNFWQNVCSTVLSQIEKPDGGDITQIVEGHILLLQTLKIAFLSDGKKVQSIKFDGDVPNETEAKIPTQEVDAATMERYNHNLNEVVEKICCNYFEYADKNDVSDAVLMPLITILNEFDGKHLYMALAKHFSATSIHDFYDKVLMKWMLRDTMCSKTIVDIIFILLKHLTEEEQEAVINTFDKLGHGVAAVEWCVGAALGHAMWGVAGSRAWLHGARVRAVLGAATARALRRECSRATTLLLMALSADARGEMLISEETASEIAELASNALSECLEASESGSQSEFDLEHVASVASHLATALAARSTDSAGYQRLVRGLLQLLLRVPRGDRRLSAGGWREARSAAHDGLSAAATADRTRAAALLSARRAALVNEVDVPQIEHMTSLAPYLLSGCSSADDVQDVVELTKQLLDFNLDPSVEIPAVRHDCVTGRFNCPFDDDNDIIRAVVKDSENPIELAKETLVPCINKVLFRASYIKTILHASTDEEDEKKEDNSWCNMLLSNDYLQMEFCKLLREFMVLRSLDEAYGFWLHHDIIRDAKGKLDAIIDDIIVATEITTRSNIKARLSELAAEEGYYWAFARRLYEVKAEGGKTVDKNPDEKVPSAVDNNEEDNSEVTSSEDGPPDTNQDNVKDTKLENDGDGDHDPNSQPSPTPNSNADEENMLQKISGKGYFEIRDFSKTGSATLLKSGL